MGKQHHNLGLLYLGAGLNMLAKKSFQAAAEVLAPVDAETTTNLGVGYFYQGGVGDGCRVF
jgi:hypothetical protein